MTLISRRTRIIPPCINIAERAGTERFLNSIDDIAPSDTLGSEISPILGCHVGPGSVGVAALRSDWRR